jgi:hypothetical protein
MVKTATSRKEWRLAGKVVPVSVVREFVFRREGECLAARYERELRVDLDDRHVCGTAFRVTSGGGLTLEHLTRVHNELDGRKNDEKHVVALCATLNGETMTLANRDMKDFFREYLRGLYPACSG